MASEHEDAGQAQARYDTSRDMKTIRTRQGNIAYLGVKGRVAWLRAEHADAEITTEKVDGGVEAGWVEFRCLIRIPNGGVASGYASETHQDFPDFYEKAETKAIGRACALLGYGTEGARDFDDGEPLDGAAASKGERAARRMEPEERAAVDAQHARNTTPPPPMNLPPTRTHGPAPSASGAYPSVARQHGINTMADLLGYLVGHGFNVPSGRKADAISDLEQTFKARITPTHGKTEADGSPTIYPGDIYDFAHFHISRSEQAPKGADESVLTDEQMRAEIAQGSRIGTGR